MSAPRRSQMALVLPIVLWVMLAFYGFLYAAMMRQPWLLLLCLLGCLGGALQFWWLNYADRWRGYKAPDGLRFAPAAAELPLLADHRAVFGLGEARNVLTGPGFVAFETVAHGRRHWSFVIPLSHSVATWHVRPPMHNNRIPGVKPVFSDRYEATGHVPETVKRALMAAPFAELDVRAHGDLLIATDIGMSRSRFPEWYRSEGQLALRIARLLDPDGPAEVGAGGSAPAIGTGNPARNVWDPGDARPQAAEPLPDPIWRQPPRP